MLALLSLSAAAAAAALPHHHPQHHAPADLLHRIAKTNPAALKGGDAAEAGPTRRPFTAGARVTPASFGADPTGVRDSWPALNAAIGHCLNQSRLSPNGFFPGQATTPTFGPIRVSLNSVGAHLGAEWGCAARCGRPSACAEG